MSNQQQLIDSLNNRFMEATAKIIDQKIKEQLQSSKISKDNLSPELIQLIMASKQGTASSPTAPPQQGSIPPSSSAGASPLEMNSTTEGVIGDLVAGNNVYLWGAAGTGKTVLAENIANYLGRGNAGVGGNGASKRTINCSQWTSPTEIRGGQTITGYKQGTMILAWQNGDYLILDELPKLDTNTAGLLNDVLSKSGDNPKVNFDGSVNLDSWVYTTDGKGDKIYKGGFNPEKAGDKAHVEECLQKAKRFGVIATGNTDMKTIDTKFGGNNRQDYSLVDRFSGSYYYIDFAYTQSFEEGFAYSAVKNALYPLRNFLKDNTAAVEAVSARTVINVNRIYQQEMLINIRSVGALQINGKPATKPLKTFKESVDNLMTNMPKELREKFNQQHPDWEMEVSQANKDESISIFMAEFSKFHGGLNARTFK